jgi:arylformamidase
MNLYRNFTTQEEVDLEYNFSLTVPDVKDWADFFVKKNAAARSNLDCSLDVRYGPTTDETVTEFMARCE